MMVDQKGPGDTAVPRHGVGGLRLPFFRALAATLAFLTTGCGSDGEPNGGGGQMARAAEGDFGGERLIPVSARIAVTDALEITLRGSTNLRAQETVEVVPKQAGLVSAILVEEGARVQRATFSLSSMTRSGASRPPVRGPGPLRGRAVKRARALRSLTSFPSRRWSGSSRTRPWRPIWSWPSFAWNAEIRSPIAGVVTHRYIERGSRWEPRPVFEVADVERLEAQVAIPERQAPRVEVGQAARILTRREASPSPPAGWSGSARWWIPGAEPFR
jgi:hypothetical protein